jgi:hypothetical protein
MRQNTIPSPGAKRAAAILAGDDCDNTFITHKR